MRAFANLLDRLSLATSPDVRLILTCDYLAQTPDPDRGYALAILTGALTFSNARPAMIRRLVGSRLDSQLLGWSHDFVGDLAETTALVWSSRPGANRPPELAEVVSGLGAASPAQLPHLLEAWLDALDIDGRWALLKLASGGLRAPLSRELARLALARLAQRRIGALEPGALDEVWHGLPAPYVELFAWLEGRGQRPDTAAIGRFRPVMLALPLDADLDLPNRNPADYAAEWKWDGVRVQAVRDGGVARLFSGTGMDMSSGFPDLVTSLTFDGVIDGELVVGRGPDMGDFSDLQQRLNRKAPTQRLMKALPAEIRAFDLLVDNGEDLRALDFRARRLRLEALLARHDNPRIHLSPLLSFDSWADLATLRANPPAGDPEKSMGLILKQRYSTYEAGPPQGAWFTWRKAPHLIDAVLLYAQRASGRGPGPHTELTFGVWDAGALIPIGKAVLPPGHDALKKVDQYVRDHTVERFGPVRRIAAEPDAGLVLEVAIDGVLRSPRHKSGITLRRPRIQHVRWDTLPEDADQLERLLSPGIGSR